MHCEVLGLDQCVHEWDDGHCELDEVVTHETHIVAHAFHDGVYESLILEDALTLSFSLRCVKVALEEDSLQ